MTIASTTTPNVTYELTETSCTCPSFHFGQGRPCKHLLAEQVRKDQTFRQLFTKYDVRASGQEDSRRCYYEMSLGY
jgi:SWIM zinc finger